MKRLVALMICAVSLGAAAQSGDCPSYMTLTSTPSGCDASGSVTADVLGLGCGISPTQGAVIIEPLYIALNLTPHLHDCLMGIPQGCESIGYALQGALNAAGVPFFYLMEELQALAPSSTIMGALYNGLSTPDAEGCVMGFPECESMGYALQFSLMDAGVSFSDLMNELQALAGAVYLSDCSISWFDSTGNLVGMGLSVSGLPAGTYTASLTHLILGCADTQTIEVLFECGGCTDEWACNYNPAASQDDYSCDYSCCPGPGCCGEGTTWNWQTSECDVTNPADINLDGCVQLNDLLDLLSAYGDCGAEESAWQCGDPLEYQGYDYETVQIGDQCWFAENLRAENYKNGDFIPANLDNSEWTSTTSGATVFYGDDVSNLQAYGHLYNWHAVDDARSLCPNAWRIPSDGDWTVLTNFLGGSATAGAQMKTTYGWNGDDDGANSSGFSGLPGGSRASNGNFYLVGSSGYWWSATPYGSSAWYRTVSYNDDSVNRNFAYHRNGYSVRCVQDAQ